MVMIVDVEVAGSGIESRESVVGGGLLDFPRFLISRFISLNSGLFCSTRSDDGSSRERDSRLHKVFSLCTAPLSSGNI